jgi:hypothetical protein
VKSNLEVLAISPYTISLNNFISDLYSSNTEFHINFDATLVKSSISTPELGTDTHKLVVEVTDNLSNKYENAEQVLKLGKNSMSIPITFTDPNNDGIEFLNANMGKSYTIKIYDEFKGYRRLLASSSNSWTQN